jgi:hypothetical protein
MTQRRILGGVLFTLGGAFLALHRQRQDLITYFPLIQRLGPVPLFLGFFLILGGFVLLLYGGLTSTLALIKRVILPPGCYRFECTAAEAEDLELLWTFYSSFFGKDVPALATMRLWHQRNPEMFWMLYKVSRPRPGRINRTLVGSFKICPVNGACVSLLEREAVSGTTIPVDAIVPMKDSSALYVGDVAATDKYARAALVAYLDSEVRRANRRGLPIYARPLTNEGFHLLTVHGFCPTSASSSDKQLGRIFKLLPRKTGRKPGKRGERVLGKLRSN